MRLRRESLGSASDFQHLPGADLIGEGLDDLAAGRESDEALLVSIGATRLRAGGVSVAAPLADPEHRLYERLALEDSDSAHSRYNALLRRLVGFESALECVAWRTRRSSGGSSRPCA